jgi:Uma2 family endonuclease
MSVIHSTLVLAQEVPPLPVRRFTVDEYHRLGQLGVLDEDDRVELLEGWIVPMMNRSPDHDTAIELAMEALRPLLPAEWRIRIQMAITTIDSEPEPDLALVRGKIRGHKGRHPRPGEAGLVIEVADTSLARDRAFKLRIYARARVPSYWIVNLIERQIEVHSSPSATRRAADYREKRIFSGGDEVPVLLGSKRIGTIRVAELLP